MNEKIYILEGISDWEYNDKILLKRLDEINDDIPITVYINSPGGSVFTAYSIYNLLLEKSKTNEITVKIIGVAASAATLIAMAGKKTLIAKTASYLIHNPYMFGGGDAERFKKMGKALEEITDQIIEVYQRKTKLNNATLKSIMKEDRMMTSQEAIKYNLIDGIYEPDKDEQSELEATNYLHNIERYKIVALNNINKNENIINNNSGDESMPDNKDSVDINKILNDKIEEVTNLKTIVNQRDVEVANLKTEVADNKVAHQKEIDAKDSIIGSLQKENKELKTASARAEVANKVSEFINTGKILPAMKEVEIDDLLDKKLNNEEAYNKKVEAYNNAPSNGLTAQSKYDVNNQGVKNLSSVDEVLDKQNDDIVNSKVNEIMKRDKCSYEDAINTYMEELNNG